MEESLLKDSLGIPFVEFDDWDLCDHHPTAGSAFRAYGLVDVTA